MDQNVATIIITVITGIFGIFTIIVQKRQDKVINKIDEQTILIDKERTLRQKLDARRKDLEAVTYKMIRLILDTNLTILQDMPGHSIPVEGDQSVYKKSEELNAEFMAITKDIDDLTHEYNLIISMTEQLDRESKD
ncbi:MAG: hypothetical protein K2N48_01200 [Muribaculaceae bacterium]|nr:hypothetical protein [Muribaculaceae bacterium]